MHPHDERPYSFCPLCGADLELRSLKPTEPDRLVCVQCGTGVHVLGTDTGERLAFQCTRCRGGEPLRSTA